MVKKSKKGPRGSSKVTAPANSSGLDRSDKHGYGCRRRQSRSGSKGLGSKTGRSLEQAKAQVSENNGWINSGGLQELIGLVKQAEVLKNKMRDLFIRAQERKSRD